MPKVYWKSIVIFLFAIVAVANVTAQNPRSSLYKKDEPETAGKTLTLENSSWIYSPISKAKEIRINDLISIRVEEKAQMISKGEVERRKSALYNGALLDWLKLTGIDTVKPAPQRDGDPRVQAELDRLYRADGELETRERLTFDISAFVVGIRPNGNLVLLGTKTVQINNEIWEHSLSGECRREDVSQGNVVLSRDIANLRINKRERGHMRDSYRRGWVIKFFDRFNPF